jgi:membrane protease YdiL (CAAX protease family)
LAKEISLIYVVALALILGCVFLGSALPFAAQNLYALVAAVFVGVPYWWLSRRGDDFERFGLTWERAGRGALWGLGFTLLTLAPFLGGYWWWQTQVQEQRYEFEVDNFLKWPVEYEGRPSQWGKKPGVFVWSDSLELHVGIKSRGEPIEVELKADKAFRPGVIGQAQLIGPKPPQASKTWTVRVPAGHTRSQLVIERAADGPPRQMDLDVRAPRSGEPATVYIGAAKSPAGTDIRIDRGLWWMVLWILTQLVFIALPEEFFYRGYLQTRIQDAIKAKKPLSEGRRVLGISAPNVIASVLFALGHLLIPIGGVLLVTRLSVFFPSLLFGWLRERTGTIAAPIVYHAGANLMVLFAAPHFF